MFARFDENPAMAYHRISIKPYIKSHLELQREITRIELAPSPYFFVESICLAYMNMFARFDENPAMAYHRISIKPYIKSHLELQREITRIELGPSPYFFVESICLAYMNMFARFDENPAMTLRVIKETKRYGRTHGHTDGRTDGRTT